MLFLASILTTITTTYAQDKGKDFCLQGTKTETLLQNPEAAAAINKTEQELESFTQKFTKNTQRSSRSNTYVIPVVFHVIHQNGPENISDAQIFDQMRILNLDFNMLNADLVDVVSSFENIIGNPEITFELAQLDPSGNPTTGIDRIYSSETSVGDDGSKLNQWPPAMYLNVWVVDQINGATGAAAYAYLPSTAAQYPGIDGIIINQRYIGSIGTSQTQRQHTLSHEIGHYFNLSHPWGPTNDPGVSSNCNVDDNVNDTPNTIGSFGTCNLSQISCGSLDNVQNIMDYASCDRMFTEGQVNRMHATLNSPVAGRSNLWSVTNLASVGLGDLAEANFTSDDQVIPEFETVTFLDRSQYGPTSINWNFTGANTQASTANSPSISYNSAGSYAVNLDASKNNNTVSKQKNNYIMVVPLIGNNGYVSESFEENGVEFWHPNENNLLVGYGWELDPNNGTSGDACMKMNNYGANSGLAYELESTTFDLSVYSSASFSFNYAYARRSSSDLDRIIVYVSTDYGQTWTSLLTQLGPIIGTGGTESSAYTPANNQWASRSFTIPNTFLQDAVQFKFSFEAGDGNNYYLDDIVINGTFNNVAQLKHPYDGMQNRSATTILNWQPMTCDQYELQYDTDPNFSNPVSITQDFVSLSDGLDSEYEATGLTFSETYYWRVRLVNASNPEQWSEVWSFTVADNGVGIDDASNEQDEFVVYPNPANNLVKIQLSAQKSNQASINIFDVFGKQVLSKTTALTSGKNIIEFDTQDWTSGVYLIVVDSETTTSTKKLVISH
tara:strand:+ start:110 stop:2458 length:2349 start_codon:yes stop_codon:yes gene_type:complete